MPGMTRACGRGQAGATRAGSEERPVLGDYAVTTPFVICRNWSAPQWRRIRAGTGTCPWLRTPDGLIGHAGAVLLRKLADQCGLTSALGAALGRKGKFPLIDRGIALVSMAVAIALGAASMSDITVLAHQEPVFGAAPCDTTVRRTLELADPATLDKIARARAAVRAHVWQLICATPAGFPWLAIAGKLLAGWLVIDLDATLITARSDKEGAAPTFKSGYGFHPLGAWCANTAESLAMLLRPGNAGSNTFADHLAVLTAAIRQIPSRMRSRLLVRVDGAGASHELIDHLLSLSSRRRTVLFTCGWAITAADEQAIGLLPCRRLAGRRGPGRRRAGRQARRRDHPPDQPGRALARRAAVDRAPHQAVAAAGQEPDRLRARHRLAVLHHRHEHPRRPRDTRRARQPPRPVHRRAAPPARRRRGRRAHREIDGPAESCRRRPGR